MFSVHETYRLKLLGILLCEGSHKNATNVRPRLVPSISLQYSRYKKKMRGNKTVKNISAAFVTSKNLDECLKKCYFIRVFCIGTVFRRPWYYVHGKFLQIPLTEYFLRRCDGCLKKYYVGSVTKGNSCIFVILFTTFLDLIIFIFLFHLN